MRNSRGEPVPYYAVILFSTWLEMKEIAQLAFTSRELFFMITGINLGDEAQYNALTTLSDQLKATSTVQGPSLLQPITYSTLTEFIITEHRRRVKNISATSNCASKIVRENETREYKWRSACDFLKESLAVTAFFSVPALSLQAFKKFDLLPDILIQSAYIPLIFYFAVAAHERICLLPEIVGNRKFSVNSTEKLRLESAIMPALQHLQATISPS